MKLFQSSRRSLRANLVMGVVSMLLPWVMFVLLGMKLLYPQVIGAFENVVQKTSADVHAVVGLQSLVLKAAMPANDYLIHGDPVELRNFARLRREADKTFEAILGNYSGLPVQQDTVRSAREEWQKATLIAEALLALPHPVGDAAAARDMQRMGAHIENTHELLDRIHGLAQQRSMEQLVQASAVMRQVMFLIAAIFSVALAMAAVSGFGLARAILVPLRALEEGASRLGAGDLSQRVEVDGQDELRQLAGTFNAMAERLEKSQAALEELSTHDGLTGLYNHREFQRWLDEEAGRHHRYGRQFSLLMLDIDHFKRVNDTLGHQAGDAVLKGMSELMGRQARAIDRVCRYGGEEFTVILPETDLDAAAHVAERLRAAVEAQPFDVNADAPLRITVSIGVASFPAHADSAQALVAAADAAMYAAKQGGRNRITRYEPALAQAAAQG
jgi:diguanylate cyclase (GGDEF)-like protein